MNPPYNVRGPAGLNDLIRHPSQYEAGWLALDVELRPGTRDGAASRSLPRSDDDTKFIKNRDNCRHPPLPPLYLEVDMCCSNERCADDLWRYAQTDEEDWDSDITDSDYEIDKADCPLGCKLDDKITHKQRKRDKKATHKEGARDAPKTYQDRLDEAAAAQGTESSSEKGQTGLIRTFLQRDTQRRRTAPMILDALQQRHIDKPSRFTRTMDCQFKRNGLLVLRMAEQLPPPIAALANSLRPTSTAGTRLVRGCRNSTFEALGYTYRWELQEIDYTFGHHYGVRRFIERFLLATLDLDPCGCIKGLDFTRRPRMVLRRGHADIVPFSGRVRSPVPDLLYGYNLAPFGCDEKEVSWKQCSQPPSASSANLASEYKNWFLFDLKRDAGGELLFPFLSFEYRGFDGSDGCGDSSVDFAARRLVTNCSCCSHTTTSLGTATLECMATATASVRIIERLNRKVRALRKDWGCPVTAVDEADIVDQLDVFANAARSSYYDSNGKTANQALRTNRPRYRIPASEPSDASAGKSTLRNRLAESIRGRGKRFRDYRSLDRLLGVEYDILIRARPVPPVAFSVAVTNTEARIYVTWRRSRARMTPKWLESWSDQTIEHKKKVALDDNQTRSSDCDQAARQTEDDTIENDLCPVHKQMRAYYTVKVATYSLHDQSQHIRFRQHLENIFNWGQGPRLKRIQAALGAFSTISA